MRRQARRGGRGVEVTAGGVPDLYNVLFRLRSHLAAQAARDWKPGEIEDLAMMLPELERHYRNADMPGAHQVAFRFVEMATARFARNRYLADDIEDLVPLLKRFSFIALQEETSEFDMSLKIFKRLLENGLARNAEQAAADIREYGDNQCRLVLRAIAKRDAA